VAFYENTTLMLTAPETNKYRKKLERRKFEMLLLRRKQQKSIKKRAPLAKIAEKKAKDHGDQANTSQLPGSHLHNLLQPALHAFRGGDVRQSLQDENEAD
jgi:hypothetical protein